MGQGLSDRALLGRLADALDRGEAVALVTVVATRRSVPRRPGSKMVVHADGSTWGSIGGGEMEARVIEEALAALADGRSRLLDYALLDPKRGDPGVCGGEVSLHVEPFRPAPTVLVVGCGHIGRAVAELAHWLGLRVVATDDRADLARPSLLPTADVVAPGAISDVLARHPTTPSTWIVVVTRSMAVDVEILPHLLAAPAAGIGVMGSRRRWEATRARLAEAGVPDDQLARVRSPIGIELGAETPEEIAVSILADVIRDRRSSRPPG